MRVSGSLSRRRWIHYRERAERLAMCLWRGACSMRPGANQHFQCKAIGNGDTSGALVHA